MNTSLQFPIPQPTLHAVLELAVASAKWTSRIQQKQKLHQVDKHGHVPLIRVASCLGRLRSRPLVINQMLCQSLDKSDDVLLSTCLKAIFRTFKNGNYHENDFGSSCHNFGVYN